MEQAIIIGAGPCGLSAAIELQRIGLSPLIIEKNCIVHSIYSYPTHLQFFSTPELLEIGGLPFATPNEKPYRHEALVYYRKAAEHYNLRIRTYEEVVSLRKSEEGFELETKHRSGKESRYQARYVVIATGYFDHPNMLGIPGEDLSKTTHYFREAHPYAGSKVTIIGGNNSAVDAALELLRVGAEVTVVYRGAELSPSIKPWVRPIFESMIQKGLIRMLFESTVTRIEEDAVWVTAADGQETAIANDFVLALTGFRPDRKMLIETGVELADDREKPLFNPDTMETNVPGLYVAGVITSGRNANEIFIESGRMHGKTIAAHIMARNESV